MNPKNLIFSLIVFAAIAFLVSCEREWNNPWDEFNNLSPEAWAPQNLQIEDLSPVEKKLTWTYDDYSIEGFKIDRKKGDEPWQVAYHSFPKETRSWSDTEITPNPTLTYEYRLYAFAGKNSSSEVTKSIAANFAAPTNLQTEKLSDKSYKLTWTDNSSGEQGFKIDRKIDENNWVTAFGTVAANQTSFTDTNVFRATSVEYQVYGFYESYESVKVTTNVNAALTSPTDLSVERTSMTTVTLTWQTTGTGLDGFKIERKYEGRNWEQLATTKIANFKDNSFQLDTLVYYRVSAYVGQYNSTWATVTFDSSIPSPSDLQITPNSISSATISWQDNSNGEEGFRIERKYESGNWSSIATTTSTNYQDNEFQLNTQVYYRICAFFGQYFSSFAEKNFNSDIPAPTNLLITPNSITSVTLTWQESIVGEEGFKIDRKTNSGAWELEYATVGTNQTSFSDNSMNWQENTYTYRIYSFYEEFNSNTMESTIFWPEVTTAAISNINYNSGTTGGSISADGNYTITARGVCYGTTPNPQISGNHTTNGSGTGTFTSNLSTLTQGVNYYVRAYATSQFGTAYGNELSFTTPMWQCGSSFTDSRDNNEYITVQIGNQCWMKENLAYLPNVSPSANGSQTSPYYYVYGYQGTSVTSAKATANYQTYGVLYNWPASLTSCPDGWHLPSDGEWTTLTTYLGGESVAGGKMKETGTTHWQSPNTGATNSSGFTGLPGGYRYYNGNFSTIGSYGYWWSSNQYLSTNAWLRSMYYYNADVYRGGDDKEYGFSVRCLRD